MTPSSRPSPTPIVLRLLVPLLAVVPGACVPASSAAQAGSDRPPVPEPGAVDPAEYLRQRRAFVAAARSGEHERVLALSDSLLAAYPHDSEVWGRRGLSALAVGRAGEASDALRHAFEFGTNAQAFVALRAAESWAARGRPDSLYAWLERALAAGFEDRVELQEDERARPFLSDTVFRRLVGLPTDTTVGRDERWRHDIDFLLEEVRRLRPHPRAPALPPEAERIAEELRRDVPDLSDEEVVAGIGLVVGALEDGHSVLYSGRRWGQSGSQPQLPVVFWRFPDGLHVVDADSLHEELVGARVTAIGGLDPDTVLRRLDPWVARDNAVTPLWLGVRFYLRSPTMLREVGAAAGDGRVALELVDRGGVVRSVTLAPSGSDLPRKLRPAPGVVRPRWLSRVDETIWMERLQEHDALYVQFNQVRDPEGSSIEAFSDSLGTELEASGARALIVDVRHNNGGNNHLLRPLVRRMIAWEVTDRERRVFVLMGRNTFSAAQNFLNRVERWTDAVFVGEPSSSRPNMIGESTNVVLPYSRLWASISSRYWQDSDPGDERPWISPDVPVAYTAADHFAGRDPVLDAVLEILEGGG